MRMAPEEERVVDPATGGEKGRKLARFDLIPVEPLRLLAEHYGRGARKYADRNWEKGYAWSLSYAALMRHLTAFWGGEDLDAETGSPHIIAAAWHAFALAEYTRTHPEKDDRPCTAAPATSTIALEIDEELRERVMRQYIARFGLALWLDRHETPGMMAHEIRHATGSSLDNLAEDLGIVRAPREV